MMWLKTTKNSDQRNAVTFSSIYTNFLFLDLPPPSKKFMSQRLTFQKIYSIDLPLVLEAVLPFLLRDPFREPDLERWNPKDDLPLDADPDLGRDVCCDVLSFDAISGSTSLTDLLRRFSTLLAPGTCNMFPGLSSPVFVDNNFKLWPECSETALCLRVVWSASFSMSEASCTTALQSIEADSPRLLLLFDLSLSLVDFALWESWPLRCRSCAFEAFRRPLPAHFCSNVFDSLSLESEKNIK